MKREELEELLREGLSLAEMGRRLGRDHSTVGYWLKRHGLESNGRRAYSPKGGLKREDLARLVDAGLTIQELATTMNRSTSTIVYWLKRHGLKTARARRVVLVDMDGDVHGHCRRHGRARFVRRSSDGYFRCARCRSEDVMRRRRRVKEILVSEAGGACGLCGYDRYVGALQFHHRDPETKEFSLSHAGVTRSLARARKEARKCALLCSNCHAEVEAGLAFPPPSA